MRVVNIQPRRGARIMIGAVPIEVLVIIYRLVNQLGHRMPLVADANLDFATGERLEHAAPG